MLEGADPLGEAFCAARTAEERRPWGQTFTPASIIRSMLEWAKDRAVPARIVDPGCGSGRYILAALRAFPNAVGIASDVDPYAVLMTRANAHVLGLESRLKIVVGDYRALTLPKIEGVTLFLGNPPYVRHHDIEAQWKTWLGDTASRMGLKASKLAGLHAHFFLATALYAQAGDIGSFITSSEWLDVNYGQLIRDLLVGPLSVSSLHVLSPTSLPFDDATVTGTITCFEVGVNAPDVRIQTVESISSLDDLSAGFPISRQRLAETSRWSVITRVTPKLPDGYVELGELARVHRGTVTGANKVWVTARDAVDLPDDFLFPAITRARELFAAGDRLVNSEDLKTVIDLPADLDVLDEVDRKRVDRFLRNAKKLGVADGYVARNRRAWWSVGLASPAPILATYMARRPPAFVRNAVDAHHINIAHGIYPRDAMSGSDLDALAAYLRVNVSTTSGRTYAGGLTKFEPREMERLVVPCLPLLRDKDRHDSSTTNLVEL
ncbi:SAM-dependent methyltransferase [Actinobaculum sp. 313]|nr:SAM-dependent methyltransferase [Actinobaculum sp. 313]